MSLKQAVENRRSRYVLSAESPIGDAQIQQIIEHSIKYAPSAFNSQSSRVVLLRGEEHRALWDITLEELRKIVPESAFGQTEKKIRNFAGGHGTILFFEDQDTVRSLQAKYPLYANNFPNWSEQHAGILLYTIWLALEDAGLGANLQHYNPVIDKRVMERWSLPANWRLVGQMPFGTSIADPGEKTFLPIEERLRVFG